MIFTKEHLQLIIEGKKTQTRRIGKKRWYAGNRYSARTSGRVRAEHYILVRSIYRQPLCEISDYDAEQEGGYTRKQFLYGFREMHKKHHITFHHDVWVIHFVYDGGRQEEARGDEA